VEPQKTSLGALPSSQGECGVDEAAGPAKHLDVFLMVFGLVVIPYLRDSRYRYIQGQREIATQ